MNLFNQCERWFYYRYIINEKPTEQTDTKYADFGSCIHELLEKEEQLTDEILNKYWNKFNLEGKGFNKEDVKNQFNYVKSLNLPIVKKEEVIHLNFEGQQLIGIIDAVLEDNTIVDYIIYRPTKPANYNNWSNPKYIVKNSDGNIALSPEEEDVLISLKSSLLYLIFLML